jgi:hypothetical protein
VKDQTIEALQRELEQAREEKAQAEAQKKAAEGYAIPVGYVPQNREQRRDLQRAMRKRK